MTTRRFLCALVPTVVWISSLHAQLIQDVTLTMSDGIRIEASIARPLGLPPSGGFPAVMLIHGYGGSKSQMNALMQVMATYGYASLAYSVRGQGGSEGVSTTMGERERLDLVEVINYLRSAPLINPNKLGVTGGSQGGIHSWMAAAHRMPGVQAVAPLIATPNFARDLVPNNCISRWLVFELTLGSVRFGNERDRIKNLILQDRFDSVLVFIDARNLMHLVDSVRIPVFQAVGWADALFPVNANIEARARLLANRQPVWSYFGTNGHLEPVVPQEATFVLEKIVEWFDHWLKGFSLAESEFPMVFYSDDRPGWPRHRVREWQPSTTMRFYVSQTALSSTPPSASATLPFALQYDAGYTPLMGWNDRFAGTNFRNAFQATPVRLMSAPLTDAVEVTGIPRAHLSVSSDGQKFQTHVRVYDVAPSGSGFEWRLMSRGNYGVRNNAPGATHQLDFECRALSHFVPAGHRIGVEISSLDMFSADVAQIVPFFASTNSNALSSPSNPSYIDLQIVGSGTVEVAEAHSLPHGFFLHQNYPNPFNPTTKMSFVIGSRSAGSLVSLRVFDVLGREVATLVDGVLPSGEHTISFDARDLPSGESSKGGYASGAYFYRLSVGERSAARRMLLVR